MASAEPPPCSSRPYALHSHISKTAGTTVVEGARRDDFSLDLDEVQRVIDHHDPNVLFLCSPNNPSGLVDPPDTVDRVLEMLAGSHTLLIVDEAYGQFAPSSAVGRIDEDTAMVVSRTFSKTWSMASARLGYLLGPSWLVDELFKVILPYHLDGMKQAAGLLHSNSVTRWMPESPRSSRSGTAASTAFEDLPVTTWNSAASFFLFRLKP